MGGCCGNKPKVKYQVKVGGQSVGKPADSIAAAHVIGKAATKGNGKTYSFTAVSP